MDDKGSPWKEFYPGTPKFRFYRDNTTNAVRRLDYPVTSYDVERMCTDYIDNTTNAWIRRIFGLTSHDVEMMFDSLERKTNAAAKDCDGFYMGTTKNGQFHGYGAMKYPDGKRFEGLWENGKRKGTGIMYYSDGHTESGDWDDEKIIGDGEVERLKLTDTTVYSGTVSDGKPNGKGTLRFSETHHLSDPSNEHKEICQIDGFWKDGILQDGKCVIFYASGWVYYGKHCSMKRSGEGKMMHHHCNYYTTECPTTEPTEILEGSWSDDEEIGEMIHFEYPGTITTYTAIPGSKIVHAVVVNGESEVYAGEMEIDGTQLETACVDYRRMVRCGHGVEKKDGVVIYEGEWDNGNYNGHGRRIVGNYFVESGFYKDGQLNGKGIRESGGGHYVGNFVDGQFHGQGKITKKDGETYDGEWRFGELTGKGKTIKADGTIYIGTHLKGMLDSTDRDDEVRFSDWHRVIGAFRVGILIVKSPYTVIFADCRELARRFDYHGRFALSFYKNEYVMFDPHFRVANPCEIRERGLIAREKHKISIFMDGAMTDEIMTQDTLIDLHFLEKRKMHAGLRRIREFAEEGKLNAQFDCQIHCLFEMIQKPRGSD